MDLENVELFVVERQVNKEHLVEAPLANHLGWKQVDTVRGGGYEESTGLLLHPGEEESENPALLAAGIGGRDPHLDLVEPEDRWSHLFHHSARLHESAFGLAVPSGKYFDHIHTIEGQLEARGDSLDGKAFPTAGDAHQQNAFGRDFFRNAIAQVEEF